MYRLELDSSEILLLRRLADGRQQATLENAKIILEDGTEVPQRAIGHLCNAHPPLVKGAIRFSSDGTGILGYLYEITNAGRAALEKAELAARPPACPAPAGASVDG